MTDNHSDDAPFGVGHARKQPFFILYNEFVDKHCRDLEYLEISVYLVLCRFAGSTESAWPSFATIAERLGAERSRVINATQKLQSKGFITATTRSRQNKSRTSNWYTINDLRKRVVLSEHQAGALIAPGVVLSGHRIEEEQLKKKKEEIAHTPTTTGLKGRSLTGLFEANGSEPRKEPTRIHRMVDRLYTSLAQRRKIISVDPPDLNAWGETIRKYIVKTGVSLDDFESNLCWWCDHMGELYVTGKIRSATAFCTRYEDVDESHDNWNRNQVKSHQSRRGEPAPPPVEIPKMRVSAKVYTQEELTRLARNS